jgi:hypothetical protein
MFDELVNFQRDERRGDDDRQVLRPPLVREQADPFDRE